MAVENNIPNVISIPGSLIGRHEDSLISPMGFSAFATRMKSDIAPMSTLSFTTRMKSDVFPIPFANFTSQMKSDISPITLRPPEMKSLFEIQINPLDGRHESSDTAPVNSILGANNEDSKTAPINSILGTNNESSATAPIISTLTGRFETSDITPAVLQLEGRHETSGIDDGATTLDGRHESSGIDDGVTTADGRHESSAIDDGLTTPDGRFTTSDIDNTPTSPDGRHESSAIDDALTTQDGRHYPGPPPPQPTIDITTGVDYSGFNTDAPGFTIQNPLLESQYQGISGADYTYPNSQGLDFGLVDTTQGVNFLDIPNADAIGFTTFNPLLESQFVGIGGSPGAMTYAYPDSHGKGHGLVDTSIGVNFVDIPNVDAQGFTTFFDVGIPTQFKGATASDYTYPDNHGLGYGLIGNSLFTNTYPTPYTTPIFPDGFTENQPLEESQFSKDSFAGGGPLGLTTEFTHALFGGVQAQVPIMGNNPTGLGELTSGGNTSGDIGIVDAFDDTTSGAKGFTPQMFDLGLPKTQFNGVAGTPGSLTYEYPVEVGPDGEGRLMYNMPFADAGNPYGGEYVSAITQQIPVNPLITINKDVGTDIVDYNLYDASPDRLHFHEGNKYQEGLGIFRTTITLNGAHPKSILADFASREGSPTPLDAMEVLIPANTGPTGESDITAKYTHVEGYPNYNTHNLSYSSAEVANQREGFARNELFARSIDYDNDGLYGHDLRFGGHGDDPNGLKMYKEPHILRDMDSNWGLFGGFDEGAFRGGFLTLGNRALKDVVRNVKHIIEDPIKGILWGLKQIGLQASNPKVETEMAFLGRRTRTFNLGIGMIANMLTGPFGIKLYRHGLLNGIGEEDATYEAAVKAHNAPDRYETPGNYPGKGGGSRLIGLKEDLIISELDTGAGGFLGLGSLFGATGQKIKSLSDTAFFGPKSLYGIGGTTIRRYYSSNVHPDGKGIEASDDKAPGGGDSNLLGKYAVMSYGSLQEAAKESPHSFNDFRSQAFLDGKANVEKGFFGVPDSINAAYDEGNREILFGYSKYDEKRVRTDFLEDLELTDPWNDPDLIEDNTNKEIEDVVDTQDSPGSHRDMIKMVMQDVQTGKYVRFRSYITDVIDTITPTWNQSQYIGRPDPVYNYKNTERNVTFTLKFAAMSRKGMEGMYKKVNFLYGLAYPHISKGKNTSDALISPYIRLTLGDWLLQTPGFFSSISTTIDNSYPWEINLENDEYMAQLPHMINCALDFKVIGDGPHLSVIEGIQDNIAGRHIGGGLNNNTAEGTIFEDMTIWE